MMMMNPSSSVDEIQQQGCQQPQQVPAATGRADMGWDDGGPYEWAPYARAAMPSITGGSGSSGNESDRGAAAAGMQQRQPLEVGSSNGLDEAAQQQPANNCQGMVL